MGNDPKFFEEKLGFMRGDGKLHLYLVNWSTGEKPIAPLLNGAILV